jgi:chromosome partitioning protein
MAVILTVANQKGGVGKTTTAVNLCAGLARRGFSTLLVDLDIQGSATASLMGPLPPEVTSIAEALVEEQRIDRCVVETKTERFLLAPAGEALATVDIHLATTMGRERVLQRCLDTELVRSTDVVVIDTAPYLGLLTVNALVAAQHLLIPVSCEYLPIVGLKLFNDTLEQIRRRLGAPCEVLGYLLTMLDRRERITGEVEELLRTRFGGQVFETSIRVNTHHKASPSHRQTIFQYEGRTGRGRQDYDQLTDEVLRRLGDRLQPARPAVEEPAVEEPAVEEPAVEEPAVEEPAGASSSNARA